MTQPSRFERPSLPAFLLGLVALTFLVLAFEGTGFSLGALADGVPSMGRVLGRMFPPDFSRLPAILLALLETFQMALVGTLLGVVLSFPLAVLAARGVGSNAVVRTIVRALVAFFRTVPDLIWALFFVVAVGLGPFAGTLAIMIDTMGFCGRFFAETMEEQDRGPQEALRALGAGRSGVIVSAIVPGALPAFTAASLFALEKATRSSVVLGLVGAGGIGIELKVAMDLFAYQQAATMILSVFVLVLLVEQASGAVRRRLL